MTECLVEGCDEDPVERLTVDDGGILVAYAVCRPHALTIRAGAMVAAAVLPTRGMIGPV